MIRRIKLRYYFSKMWIWDKILDINYFNRREKYHRYFLDDLNRFLKTL